MNIQLSEKMYQLTARILGIAVVLYGGGALLSYFAFVFTGTNGIARYTNGMGALFLTFMGAFAVPLGLALMRKGAHQPVLLMITGVALLLNGLLRMTIFLVPEILASVEVSEPNIELVVFSSLALLAFSIRRKSTAQEAS